jgi:hypothetical protein
MSEKPKAAPTTDKPHTDEIVVPREVVERERAASTLLHPAEFSIASLCQGEIDPEAVKLRQASRRERDAALDASLNTEDPEDD